MALEERMSEFQKILADVERQYGEQLAPHRSHSSPVVDEWRRMMPHLRTSGLLIYMTRPDQMPGVEDLSKEQLSAIMVAIVDELDRRIPRPTLLVDVAVDDEPVL